MGDKKIEQIVNVSGNARTGPINLIGEIIRQPAAWQDAVWRFLTGNWHFVIIWLSLEVLIGIVYSQFRNLYMISLGRYLLFAGLITVAFWSAYDWFRYK